MEFFDNHKKLFGTAAVMFVTLTLVVAIMPAIHNQNKNKSLAGAVEPGDDVIKGKAVFIANGCVACHTQQVRNVDMDKVWGSRPGIAADYANIRRTDFWRNTATLMGTERTGPDLTNIGNRQPSQDWHLVHLFNPRIVVKESVMPAYPWLFTIKKKISAQDIAVNVPSSYLQDKESKVVANKNAVYLVAYLQYLKQAALPDGKNAPEFLYKQTQKQLPENGDNTNAVNGKELFAANCQACHQANGEGLPGAFPSLKGSPVVTGDNLQLYIDIIMNGYDANPGYGVMPPVGTNMGFTENEVAAIVNYERNSWGNKGGEITPEEVKKIMEAIQLKISKE